MQNALTDATDAPRSDNRKTRFAFEHKIFALDDVYFAMTRDRREPALFIRLGVHVVAVPLSTVGREFSIPRGSPDGILLETVTRALRYVAIIHPNDEIPTSLIDGSAPWGIESRHLELATAALERNVIAWSERRRTSVAEETETSFDATAETAFQELAAALVDVSVDIVRRQADSLVRELVHIEALRERSGRLHAIAQKIALLKHLYRKDAQTLSDLARIVRLLRQALAHHATILGTVDRALVDPVLLFADPERTRALIRQVRDELHERLMPWDEILRSWEAKPVEMSEQMIALIGELYHFCARTHVEARPRLV